MGCNQSNFQHQPQKILNENQQNSKNQIINSELFSPDSINGKSSNKLKISHDQIFISQEDINLEQSDISIEERQIKQENQYQDYENDMTNSLEDIKQRIIIQINDTSSLIEAFQSQIFHNPIYNSYLNKKFYLQIFSQIQKGTISHFHLFQIVSLLLNSIQNSMELMKDEKMITKSQLIMKQVNTLAKSWLRIVTNLSRQRNKMSKVLSYITLNPEANSKKYSHGYFQLKFEDDFGQYKKVLDVVKEIVSDKPQNFCLFTNYLLICCQSMIAKHFSIIQIEDRLKQKISFVYQQHKKKQQSILLQNDIQDSNRRRHPSFKAKLKDQEKKYFTFPSDAKERSVSLFEYIGNQLEEAKQNQFYFYEFVAEISKKTNFYFNCQRMQNSEQSVLIISQTFFNLSLQKYIPNEADEQSQNKLKQFMNSQLIFCKKQKEQVFSYINDKIQFKISNIIIAETTLQTLNQINACVDTIKEQIQTKKYILVQLKNNLNGKDTFRSIIIVLIVHGVRAEIRLILNYDISNRILSNYFQQLNGSKYSSITLLHMLHNRLVNPFIETLSVAVKQHVRKQSKSASRNTLFYFRQLIKLLNIDHDPKDIIYDFELFSKFKEPILKLMNLAKTTQQAPKIIQLSNSIYFKNIITPNSTTESQINQLKSYIDENYPNIFSSLSDTLFDNLSLQMNILSMYASSLKLLGQSLKQRNQLIKAVQILQEYIELILLISTEPNEDYLLAIKWRCQCQKQQFNFNKALDILLKCQHRIKQCEAIPHKDKLMVKYQIGKIYMEQNITSKALQYFNQIITTIYEQKINSYQLESEVLQKIALIFIQNEDYQQSIIYLDKSKRVIEQHTGKNNMLVIPILMILGTLQQKQNKYKESLTYYLKSEEIIQKYKSEHSLDQIEVYNRMGNVYVQILEYQEAERVYLLNLKIVEKQKGKSSSEYGQVSEKLGQLYIKLQKYSKSLKYLLKSLSLKQKTYGKQTVNSLQVTKAITDVLKEMKHYKYQEQYLHKLGNIIAKQKANENMSHVNTYNNIAVKSLNRGNYLVALKYYGKSLNILSQIKGKQSIQSVSIHKNMGLIFKIQQNVTASLKHFKTCLQILQQVKGKDNVDSAQILYEMGGMYEIRENEEKAQQLYLEAYKLCCHFKIKYAVYAQCCRRLAKIQQKNNKHQQALNYLLEALPIFQKMAHQNTPQIRLKIEELKDQIQ